MRRLSIVLAVGALALVGCGGDGGPDDRDELTAAEAKGAVRNYYTALDNFEYREAWAYLGRNAKAALGQGFGGWSRSWKRNYQMDLTALTVKPRDEATATVAVTLDRLDYDACNSKVWQTYSGDLTVKLAEGVPLVQSESLGKVAGAEPETAFSDCETILPPPPTQPLGLASRRGGDLDCPDIGHPVQITGSDPHGLDGDGDGIGCDAE